MGTPGVYVGDNVGSGVGVYGLYEGARVGLIVG